MPLTPLRGPGKARNPFRWGRLGHPEQPGADGPRSIPGTIDIPLGTTQYFARRPRRAPPGSRAGARPFPFPTVRSPSPSPPPSPSGQPVRPSTGAARRRVGGRPVHAVRRMGHHVASIGDRLCTTTTRPGTGRTRSAARCTAWRPTNAPPPGRRCAPTTPPGTAPKAKGARATTRPTAGSEHSTADGPAHTGPPHDRAPAPQPPARTRRSRAGTGHRASFHYAPLPRRNCRGYPGRTLGDHHNRRRRPPLAVPDRDGPHTEGRSPAGLRTVGTGTPRHPRGVLRRGLLHAHLLGRGVRAGPPARRGRPAAHLPGARGRGHRRHDPHGHPLHAASCTRAAPTAGSWDPRSWPPATPSCSPGPGGCRCSQRRGPRTATRPSPTPERATAST